MHEKKNYMYTTLTTTQNATVYHAANNHGVRWGRLITKSAPGLIIDVTCSSCCHWSRTVHLIISLKPAVCQPIA